MNKGFIQTERRREKYPERAGKKERKKEKEKEQKQRQKTKTNNCQQHTSAPGAADTAPGSRDHPADHAHAAIHARVKPWVPISPLDMYMAL